MSIRERIEDDLEKKASPIDEDDYDYENESQSSTPRQQHRQSTPRQLATSETTLLMNPNAPGAPYIARRVDVNDKPVPIRQPRAVEKKKWLKNRSKNESFSPSFSKRGRLF